VAELGSRQRLGSLCKKVYGSTSSSPLALRYVQDFGFLQDQFPSVSAPSYLYPASKTPFFSDHFQHH
jgi:hypothetical protein